MGTDGRILEVNQRAADILGHPRVELVGKPVLDLYADTSSGKDKAQLLFQRFLAGEPIDGEELQIRRADGTLGWIRRWVAAIRDSDGRVIASSSALEDITAHKEAELHAANPTPS